VSIDAYFYFPAGPVMELHGVAVRVEFCPSSAALNFLGDAMMNWTPNLATRGGEEKGIVCNSDSPSAKPPLPNFPHPRFARSLVCFRANAAAAPTHVVITYVIL
jgi:hypothetical protein